MGDVSTSLIERWLEAKEQLSDARETEKMLREHITKKCFGSKQGVFTYTKEMDDYKIIAQSRATNKFDDALVMTMLHSLSEAEQECFSNKLVLSDTKLKKLSKTLPIWKLVTQFPAMPTLTITRKVVGDE